MSKPFILSVTSGKGGVGKTAISVNISIILAKKGIKVLLFDGDFGLANAEILLGVVPKRTLKHYFLEGVPLEEIGVKGPYNMCFLTSYSGMKEIFEENPEKARNFLEDLKRFARPFDILVIDTGAGITKKVTSLCSLSDTILVILNKEPTSLTDAYGIIKVMTKNYGKRDFAIVVNRANEEDALNTYKKLKEVTSRFLSLPVDFLGYIPDDPVVPRSISLQKPASVAFSSSHFSRSLELLGEKLVKRLTKSDEKAL